MPNSLSDVDRATIADDRYEPSGESRFHPFPHISVLKHIVISPVKVKGVAPDEAHQTAMRLLERNGMPEKANVYPHRLAGERQKRLAIAHARAVQPEVMLFDQPAAALDPEMIEAVLHLMRGVADRIAFMDVV